MNAYDTIRRVLNRMVSDGGSYTADVGDAFAALAELEREPTPDECERICFTEMKIQPAQSWPAIRGRAMFDAVRAVMGGES